MARLVGHGDAFDQADLLLLAGVRDLEEKFLAPLVKVHVDDAVLPRLHQGGAGVQGVFQGVGQQHAQVAVRGQDKVREIAQHLHGDPGLFRLAHKGREDEVHGVVFAVALDLLGLDLLADGGDVFFRLVLLVVLDAVEDVLQVVAQVVAVAAGQILGLPHGVDLPHGLGQLHAHVVLDLLGLDLIPLDLGVVQQEDEVGHAAQKGHKLHRHRLPADQDVRIDPREIVESIVHDGDRPEKALGLRGVVSQIGDGGGRPFQQGQEQRQGHQHLHAAPHQLPAPQQLDHEQRDPPPQLAAEVGRENGNEGPQGPAGQKQQHKEQGEVDQQRVDLPQEAPVPQIVDPALEHGDQGHRHPEDPLVPPGGQGAAKIGRQHAAEQAHGPVVAKWDEFSHTVTWPF